MTCLTSGSSPVQFSGCGGSTHGYAPARRSFLSLQVSALSVGLKRSWTERPEPKLPDDSLASHEPSLVVPRLGKPIKDRESQPSRFSCFYQNTRAETAGQLHTAPPQSLSSFMMLGNTSS